MNSGNGLERKQTELPLDLRVKKKESGRNRFWWGGNLQSSVGRLKEEQDWEENQDFCLKAYYVWDAYDTSKWRCPVGSWIQKCGTLKTWADQRVYFWQSDLVHLYKEVTNTWGKSVLGEEKASEMIEVRARRPTWLQSRDSGESGGTQSWRGRSDHVGLVGLLRTLDYKLCKMRTPSGEVRAGELCVCSKGSLWLPHEPWTGGNGVGKAWMWQEWKLLQQTKQEMIVAYKGHEGLDVKNGHCHDIFQNEGLLMAWRQSVREKRVSGMTPRFLTWAPGWMNCGAIC